MVSRLCILLYNFCIGAVFSGLADSGNRRGAEKNAVRRNSVPVRFTDTKF